MGLIKEHYADVKVYLRSGNVREFKHVRMQWTLDSDTTYKDLTIIDDANKLTHIFPMVNVEEVEYRGK